MLFISKNGRVAISGALLVAAVFLLASVFATYVSTVFETGTLILIPDLFLRIDGAPWKCSFLWKSKVARHTHNLHNGEALNENVKGKREFSQDTAIPLHKQQIPWSGGRCEQTSQRREPVSTSQEVTITKCDIAPKTESEDMGLCWTLVVCGV